PLKNIEELASVNGPEIAPFRSYLFPTFYRLEQMRSVLDQLVDFGNSYHVQFGNIVFACLFDEIQNSLAVNCDLGLRSEIVPARNLVVLYLKFELVFFVTHQLEKGFYLGTVFRVLL